MVLDLGCGSGRHILYCIENGYYPIGLDLSKVALNQAKTYLRSKRYILNKNYNTLKLKNNIINIRSVKIKIVF